MKQAIKLQPNYANAHYNRGNILAATGDIEGAISDYTTAIKIDAKLAEAYGHRGLLRVRSGDAQAGLQDLQQAADLFQELGDPENYQRTLMFIEQVKQQQHVPPQ